jgi:hypothetical protein
LAKLSVAAVVDPFAITFASVAGGFDSPYTLLPQANTLLEARLASGIPTRLSRTINEMLGRNLAIGSFIDSVFEGPPPEVPEEIVAPKSKRDWGPLVSTSQVQR